MRFATTVSLVLLSSAFAPVTVAQEWGRFRGPNGSGVSDSTGLPTEFGPEENLAWKTELPFSTSSPIVSGDGVYVTGSTDEILLVLCLDRADGSVRWEGSLDRARKLEIYPANDSASPSPVCDGENVYAFFPELGLVSYDAEGEHRWTTPLGPFVSFYGLSGSPILAGDALILLCDQQQGSHILAVHKDTGKQLWKTERTGAIESWTTPVLHPVDAPETVVVFGSFNVCGYSIKTGEQTWRIEGLGYTPVCSPIVDGDRVFATVPFHAEQPLPKWEALAADHDANKDAKLTLAELGGNPLAEHFGWADMDKDDFIVADEWAFVNAGMSSRDYGLVAIDLERGVEGVTPKEIWRYKRALPSISSPLLVDGLVYLANDGGIVTALDAESGEVLKRERIPAEPSQYYPSPIAADGKIYVASNAGQVTVLEAGYDWEVLAVNDLEEEIQATPAIADGALYIRTRTGLSCFRQPAAR